jgi:outer membrane protein OmpA-like peptidoglycan-associated protein
MRKNILLFTLLASCLAGTPDMVMAQRKDDAPAHKLPFAKKMKFADDLYKSGSFYNAIEFYQELKDEQPRNSYIVHQLAECYMMTRNYPPAAQNYKESYALNPGDYETDKYKEGLMLKQAGGYSDAKGAFQYYLDHAKVKDKVLRKSATREIEGCELGIVSPNNPGPYYVKNAGPNVNKPYTETSPLPLGDTVLLYSSMPLGNSLVEVGTKKDKNYTSRLMVSPRAMHVADKDSFMVPTEYMDGKFNDPRYHVGNPTFNAGRDKFFFTKCTEGDSFQIKCKIFMSEFKAGKWETPRELDQYINDPQSSNTHPHICMIGKKEVLFFSSNRKGQTAGGYDLWYSAIDKNGTFRRPQNCGKKINTWGDEISPSYDTKTGTLYFASNGMKNIGGFDIFYAKGGPSRYTEVGNMGTPINSPADDMFYIKDPSGSSDGWLVSNRMGSIALQSPTCCDDIWRVWAEPEYIVKGRVYDEETRKPIDEVSMQLHDATMTINDTFNSKDGAYQFRTPIGRTYTIRADKSGYYPGSINISTTDKTYTDKGGTFSGDVYLQKIPDIMYVKNVYYDFDKASLRPQSFEALDSVAAFMQSYPFVQIEVVAHTDNVGSDAYNMTLSQERAEAVVEYLVSKGVEASHLTARGMGSKMPLEANAIGKADNPEGRQYNRRTEFRIVGEVPGVRVVYDKNRPEYIDRSGSKAEARKRAHQVENMDPDNQAPDNQ